MKKIVSTFVILLAFTAFSFAQLGFRGGINISDQNYTGTFGSGFEASGKIGYLIGINYKINLGETFSLRSGAEYALKGTEIIVNGAETNSNFDYLEIPVDVIYQSGIFAAYAGPYFAFLTSAKSGDIDIKPDMKSMDIGLNLGLEINISKIGVGAKYGLGLSDISDYQVVGDIDIKNNVLSLYVTFTL